MNLRPKYRVCEDTYLGYEVQIKYWYFPFWHCVGSNTHMSLELAERWAVKHSRRVVKVLDI